MTAYDIPIVDRSSVGARRGRVIEGVVQELEVPSARVLFEWRSLDHVALTESYSKVAPAVRLLPRQLDRPRRRRKPARLGPEHVDRLQDRPRHRQGDLAARRQEERLRDGAGNAVRLAARRPPSRAGRQPDHALRQCRRPAGGAAVARAGARARHEDACGRPSPTSTSTGRAARSRLRQRPAAAERQRRSSAGAPSPSSPSTPPRAPSCSTRSSRTGARTTARCASRGRSPVRAAEARRSADSGGTSLYVSWNGATGVHDWQVLAGPRPRGPGGRACPCRRRGFETALSCPEPSAMRRVVALDRPGSLSAGTTTTQL